MDELKPCPKCGQMPERQFNWRSAFTMSVCLQRYVCPDCGVKGEPAESTSEAIEAWNRRKDNEPVE